MTTPRAKARAEVERPICTTGSGDGCVIVAGTVMRRERDEAVLAILGETGRGM